MFILRNFIGYEKCIISKEINLFIALKYIKQILQVKKKCFQIIKFNDRTTIFGSLSFLISLRMSEMFQNMFISN